MKCLPIAATVTAITAGGACVVVDGDSSLTIENASNHVLYEVHLADVHDTNWGPDLLPGALFPGEELLIDGIDCGHYDVLAVGAGTVRCVLPALHLCFDDHRWVITNATLAACGFPRLSTGAGR